MQMKHTNSFPQRVAAVGVIAAVSALKPIDVSVPFSLFWGNARQHAN
jgi:hypothetical protein